MLSQTAQTVAQFQLVLASSGQLGCWAWFLQVGCDSTSKAPQALDLQWRLLTADVPPDYVPTFMLVRLLETGKVER